VTILQVRDLKTQFFTRDGVVRAVDGVSFDLDAGETLGIVGESGCGKSVTALSILRLIPAQAGRIVGGSVTFEGTELTSLSESEMRKVRGHSISMIFQEPMTSLNPVLTVGTQIAENVVQHWGVGWREARDRAREVLELVRLSDPKRRLDEYPHQLSGGMRQRVMIAMALACDPKLLIADEPTTALDVTIQAQILDLIRKVQDETGAALMLITHDLGVVAETVQDVVVMYAGRVVEQGTVDDVLERPQHPYTLGLLRSRPRLGSGSTRLERITGQPPSLIDLPAGCPFHPRCRFAHLPTPCATEPPDLLPSGGAGQLAACHFRGNLSEATATLPIP
jgi:peptide/nickel transport system ATP-binding protein